MLRLRAPVKIFGDLHGQLTDLHRLFGAFGSPSADGDIFATDYLFVGDFVDRGHHQLEVICLLLALKVAHPAGVHLLRGNHEIQSINTVQGFQVHCIERLGGGAGERVCERMNRLFEGLPLAALIETPPPHGGGAGGDEAPAVPTRVLCLHGAQRRECLRAHVLLCLHAATHACMHTPARTPAIMWQAAWGC